MTPDGPKMGPGGFFPTNPDLADILGDTDFDFENFYFWDFLGSQLGPSLGPAWARAWAGLGPGLGPGLDPGLGAGLGPGLGPSLGPGLGPDAAGAGAGRTLRSQPDPSPNAPRDRIRRKCPFCDLHHVENKHRQCAPAHRPIWPTHIKYARSHMPQD